MSTIAGILIRADLGAQDLALLGLDLLDAALQVGGGQGGLVHGRDEEGRVGEEPVHLLERAPGRLGQEGPEEEGVGQVADDEEEVVPVADRLHGRARDLPDHGVEGKRRHGRDGHALGPRLGVEHLGRYDPGQRPAGGAEAEVVGPGDHDEAPGGRLVVVGRGGTWPA